MSIYIYLSIYLYIYYLISIHPWPLDPHFQASMPRLASTRKRLITGRNSSSGISEMDPQSPIWWKCHEMNPLKPWLGRKSFCMDIPKEYQACGLVCKVRPPISQGQHSLSSMRSFTFGSSRILLQARCTCRIKKEMLIMNFKAASLHFASSWWDFP